MKMLQRIPRKIYLLFLVLMLVLLAVGFAYKQIWYKSVKPAEPIVIETKYVSFSGNYLFSIPAKYTANGIAMPGVTIVYPEASLPENGQSLNDLYSNGTVTVQPIGELKDNNSDAFTAYTKNVLAVDLTKTFEGVSDIRPTKQKGVIAAEVSAVGEGGKILRVDYAINFTKPILVAAQDRSEAFKVVGLTMEELKNSSLKSDIDQAAGATKEVAEKLQQQSNVELRKNATSGFKSKMTEEQLADTLNKSIKYLQRPINIVGGLYNGNFFIAQLVFEAKVEGEQSTPGIVSLQKMGEAWKLDDLQLPQ